MATTKVRLTKTTVESAGVGITWDSGLRGYGLRVSPRFARSYFVQKRLPGGKEILLTIGRHGILTAEQARSRAKVLLGQIASGIDPTEARRGARKAEQDRKAQPTVADLAALYEAEHLPSKRERSADEDRALIRSYILPAIGKMKVADVTKADIARMHRAITGKPYRANRALACASKMFAMAAVDWGWRADNPCRAVKKNAEDGRERYLEDDEIARLADVLAVHPEKITVAVIRFLLFTGCRFGEAVNATWSQFNLAAGTWTKPSSHTKQKKQHTVPLSAPAPALLIELKAAAGDSPYVFPSPKSGSPLVTIKTAWAKIRRDAGIPDVRLHDLRHSFASLLASSGASLQLIGSLLGHTQSATTARYSHLTDRARREAVERVGALIIGNGQPAAEIIPLPPRRA
jgi:integrase